MEVVEIKCPTGQPQQTLHWATTAIKQNMTLINGLDNNKQKHQTQYTQYTTLHHTITFSTKINNTTTLREPTKHPYNKQLVTHTGVMT